ncbi:MmgE/PrpD family protein [Chitinophaga sp.]|uniref:MmgE/PrpD family protein n=1 Tax=Chitinophaga sp. TaxID=1869181 RepID=UPI002C0FA124|nr:MmgE/PrpD family protein [Chitinophaga sp.]HWV66681.1 MmgE/PrpD family protein [Chitinophaga sp.]
MSTQIQMMAEYTNSIEFSSLPPAIIQQLKIHLLDSLASLIFSTRESLPQKVARALGRLSGIQGTGFPLKLAPNFAAQYYTTLIRYPDFMDNFLAKESTCHPSDNIGALLAAAHAEEVSGSGFLAAMALSYEMECRLTEQLPVMISGHDHTTLLAFSATAGIGKLLKLPADQLMNALGIAGCSYHPLVTSRASYTSQWKGLASSLVNEGCMNICMLAQENITGPVQLFEIPEKGLNDIYGLKLEYDWTKDKFELIPRCCLKTYNAEVHTQSAIAAAVELKEQHHIKAEDIRQVDVTTFLTAFHIVGGGEYGSRTLVHSKEQADHSMAYVIAAALLDGEVTPAQLTPERITRTDVQELLQKVATNTGFPLHRPVKVAGLLDPYTAAYPDKVKSSVAIRMKNGTIFKAEKDTYKGFYTTPFTWEDAAEKFKRLSGGRIPENTGEQIMELVADLEHGSINQLLQIIFKS